MAKNLKSRVGLSGVNLRLIVAFGICFIFFGALKSQAISKPEQVILTVPSTTLTVQGRASPNALVSVREGVSTVATITADLSGNFSSTLTLSAGIHNLTTFYDDVRSNRSSIAQSSVSLQAHSNTNLYLFLAPTIARSSEREILKGENVVINGYSAADSQIDISVDGLYFQSVSTNSAGFYEIMVDTSTLGTGSHFAKVIAKKNTELSLQSNSVTFLVISNSEPVTPDILVSPDQLPPPIPQSPTDGSVIEGDSVVVSGESAPNAQINIFENGILYGSIFSDDSGRWTFNYLATSTPVTLTFQACVNGRCSVLSISVTLEFSKINTCKNKFELSRYRYWGVQANEKISVDVLLSSGDGVLVFDWGNGVQEVFNHDASRPRSITSKYKKTGNYNANVTFKQDNCEYFRYFSVNVEKVPHQTQYMDYLLLVTISAFVLWSYRNQKSSKTEK